MISFDPPSAPFSEANLKLNRNMNLREARWILRQNLTGDQAITFTSKTCAYFVKGGMSSQFIRYLVEKRGVPTRPWSRALVDVFEDIADAHTLLQAMIPIEADDLIELWFGIFNWEMRRRQPGQTPNWTAISTGSWKPDFLCHHVSREAMEKAGLLTADQPWPMSVTLIILLMSGTLSSEVRPF